MVEKRPENEYVDEVTYEQVPLEQRGELSLSSGKYLNYTGKLTVNYNKQFGEKHLLFFGAGAEINQNRTSTYSFTATGFADDRYSDPAFAIQFMEDSRPGSSESTTRSIGLLAMLTIFLMTVFSWICQDVTTDLLCSELTSVGLRSGVSVAVGIFIRSIFGHPTNARFVKNTYVLWYNG